MIPEFVRHQSGDFDTNRAQDAVLDWINELKRQVPILDGVLIPDLTFAVSETKKVEHGLGRKWRGYFVTARNANLQQIYDDGTPDANFLNLTNGSASITGTISIWVF